MTRRSTPLVLLLTLVCGILAGLLLGRGGPTLSAQGGAGGPAAVAHSVAVRPAETLRGASENALYEQLARQYLQFEQVNRTFELVARVVSPAVVHIVAEKVGRTDESTKVRHYEETGSGAIVRGDHQRSLYVLTNNHVVEGALPARISIFLQDGRSIHPEQVWLDAKADIAVLKLGREDLPAARLGNSEETRVGEWVMALGSPFGLMHSVSQGIISARGRHMDELQDVENQDFLQTDAAINPGNSGGPLVNMKGEVIGINNSIASNGGGNEGVGFSIPINLARWIMDQLVSQGRVNRGALGINLRPEFRPEDAASLGLERPHGAWVKEVPAGSPASRGGLLADDVIVKFQGVEVHDLNHLINMVSMAPIGQPAEVVVWRGRASVVLTVTVGDRERTVAQAGQTGEKLPAQAPRNGLLRRPDRPMASSNAAGVEFQTMDEQAAKQLGLPANLRGAVILKVTPESPLASVLKPLDVVYSVNGRGVTTAEEALKAFGVKGESLAGFQMGVDRVNKGAIERRSVRVP